MTDVLCLHTKPHRTSEPYNQKSALLSVEIKLCLFPLVMGSLLHQAQQTWELRRGHRRSLTRQTSWSIPKSPR